MSFSPAVGEEARRLGEREPARLVHLEGELGGMSPSRPPGSARGRSETILKTRSPLPGVDVADVAELAVEPRRARRSPRRPRASAVAAGSSPGADEALRERPDVRASRPGGSPRRTIRPRIRRTHDPASRELASHAPRCVEPAASFGRAPPPRPRLRDRPRGHDALRGADAAPARLHGRVRPLEERRRASSSSLYAIGVLAGAVPGRDHPPRGRREAGRARGPRRRRRSRASGFAFAGDVWTLVARPLRPGRRQRALLGRRALLAHRRRRRGSAAASSSGRRSALRSSGRCSARARRDRLRRRNRGRRSPRSASLGVLASRSRSPRPGRREGAGRSRPRSGGRSASARSSSAGSGSCSSPPCSSGSSPSSPRSTSTGSAGAPSRSARVFFRRAVLEAIVNPFVGRSSTARGRARPDPHRAPRRRSPSRSRSPGRTSRG